jgi:hypothetical protein
MSASKDWEVARRSDQPQSGSWGIYSRSRDRWVDMIFSSEIDARKAAAILMLSNAR